MELVNWLKTSGTGVAIMSLFLHVCYRIVEPDYRIPVAKKDYDRFNDDMSNRPATPDEPYRETVPSDLDPVTTTTSPPETFPEHPPM